MPPEKVAQYSSRNAIIVLFYNSTEILDNMWLVKSPFISFGSLAQKELPIHRNAGMEVVLVSEGRLRWRVDGRAEDVPAGSVFFTLPWQAHGSDYVHEPGNRIHFVQFRLDREYASPAQTFGFHPALGVPPVDARRMSRILCSATQHSWPASGPLQWLLLNLVSRLESGDTRLFTQGLFLSMLAELVDTLSGKAPERAPMSPSEHRVVTLAARLDSDCSDAWPLSRMMADTSLGATQLTATFKRLTGDSPVAYLKRARVVKAESLLVDTDRSVTDIAFDCGFSTTQLFCRIFKAFTNRTPTQYRREMPLRNGQPVREWSEKEERERHDALRRHEWL